MTLVATPETRLTVDEGHVVAARRIAAESGSVLVLRTADGTEQELPENLQHLLFSAMRRLAESGSVFLGTLPEELTTTVAADLLGVSRPTLMKWVADGRISAHKVGTHTRFRRDDVLRLRRTRNEERRAALRELMEAEAELED